MAAAALLLTLPAAVPAAVSAGYAATGWRPLTAWAGLASPATILACAAALAADVPAHGALAAYGGLLRADALTVWILLGIGAVGALACAASPSYLAAEQALGHSDAPAARRYAVLVHLFLAAMALATLTANLGVLWVAVEATTIVTAFLVGHRRTRASV